jgi:tetratricopeptide (TPR) repeat protein
MLKKPVVHSILFLLGAVLLTTYLYQAPKNLPNKQYENLSPDNAAVMLALHYKETGSSGPMQGISMLKKIVKSNPQNTNALWYLGLFSMQSGQYDKAINWFALLLPQLKGEEKVNVLLAMAEAQFHIGDTAARRNTLMQVFDISNDSLLLQSIKENLNIQ